jgi:hypothetical protein
MSLKDGRFLQLCSSLRTRKSSCGCTDIGGTIDKVVLFDLPHESTRAHLRHIDYRYLGHSRSYLARHL